jgi:hypothetical protein
MATTGQIWWPSAGRTHDRHWAIPGLWHKVRDAGDYGYGELLDVAIAIP